MRLGVALFVLELCQWYECKGMYWCGTMVRGKVVWCTV